MHTKNLARVIGITIYMLLCECQDRAQYETIGTPSTNKPQLLQTGFGHHDSTHIWV